MRCLQLEMVKSGGKWKCVVCGRLLTISENIENSKLVSEAMATAIASGRPLDEVFDDIIGRREWKDMLARIPHKLTGSKRERRTRTTKKKILDKSSARSF